MNYIGTSMNDAMFTGESAAALKDKAFHAVKFDNDGNVAICDTEGEVVLGVLPAEEGNKAKGDTVTVQIKDIALMVAAGSIAAGAAVTTDANGKAKAATAGKFIIGYAMKAATGAGKVIPVQIAKGVMQGGSDDGQGGGSFPELTAQDEGKALVAQNGAWTKGSGTRVVEAVFNQSGGVELQDVTLEDLYNLVQNNIVVYGSIRMEVGPGAFAYSMTKLETIVSGGGTFFALFVGCAEGKLTTCTFEGSETGTMREYQTLPAFDENDIGKIPMVVSDGEGGARVGWYTPA